MSGSVHLSVLCIYLSVFLSVLENLGVYYCLSMCLSVCWLSACLALNLLDCLCLSLRGNLCLSSCLGFNLWEYCLSVLDPHICPLAVLCVFEFLCLSLSSISLSLCTCVSELGGHVTGSKCDCIDSAYVYMCVCVQAGIYM